ncbi:hypothetical protein [Vibrio vulnificus]|uniref:hypothetical protein n=1 Tax=Vibrio vulnificus TaxID=672 RepID=UPI0015E06F7F|nr:hypothetical protein [Vibrio vulnificus]EKZ9178140.1 hypothetical protein [Vibrio vulnificus]
MMLISAIKRLGLEPDKLKVYQREDTEDEQEPDLNKAFAAIFGVANKNKVEN